MKQAPSFLDTLGRSSGLLFLVLTALIALVPVNPVPAWLTEDLILRWFALVLMVICSALYLRRHASAFSWNLGLTDTLVVLLTGWILLSSNHSAQSFDSYYALKNFLVVVLLWFSLRALWELFPELYPLFEKFFWATAVLAGAWVFLSTMGHLFLYPIFQNIIPREGTFTNQNIAAGYLGMALIFAMLRLVRKEKVELWALLTVMAGWGCTESRGAFLSLLVVIVVYSVLNTKELETTLTRWKQGQWTKFMVIVGLLVLVSVPMINRVFHAVDMDPRAYFRVYVWMSAIHMIMAQPLWGFGTGTFGDVYPAYRSGSLWNTATPFAHNEYLQVAAECGLPALLLTLGLLGALLVYLRRHFAGASSFAKLSSESRAAEFAFYMLLLEAVHNFVDFTVNSWCHPLTLLAFVTFAMKKKDTEEDLKLSLKLSPRFQWFVGGALLLLVLLVMGWGSFKDYASQMENFKSVYMAQAGNLDGAEEKARRSIQWRPNNMNPWNSLGGILDMKATLTKAPKESEKIYTEAKADFDQAARLSPYSLTPRENEIQDLVKRGRFYEAMDIEKSLIEKAPEDPSHYLGLSMILVKVHRPADALAPIQQALDIDDYFVPAQLLKGEILEQMGKKTEALKTYEHAAAILKELNMQDPTGQLPARIQALQGETK